MTDVVHGENQRRSGREQLKAVAQAYFDGLERGDFSLIPFADDVVLRAPLAPGGVHNPLTGKDQVKQIWWGPIQGAIGRVQILDHYFNEDLTGICTAALVRIAGTDVVLRVADRFKVNTAGFITEQENHFDPRDLTNPGWASASGTKP
jgi:hypothetical protein